MLKVQNDSSLKYHVVCALSEFTSEAFAKVVDFGAGIACNGDVSTRSVAITETGRLLASAVVTLVNPLNPPPSIQIMA